MVKVVYCDRCGKELDRREKWEENGFGSEFDFDDFFNDKGFSTIGEATLDGKKIKIPKRVIKVQLCQECLVGYNKLIDEANEKVRDYLRENKKKFKKE